MDKDEMKNRISMALKDPILQQGFEIICKENEQIEHLREERNYFQEKCEDIELNYYCDHKGGCKVQELEKENAVLKGRNEGFEQQIMGLLIKYEEVYKRFPDLKSAMDKAQTILKENAELKSEKGCEICTKFDEVKLTKAIGIIKRWYETNRSACIEPSQELIEVTEQFLKEIEK